MYFGYWLKSPVEHSSDLMDYAFAAFHGGNDMFTVLGDITDNPDDLTAKYVGGAAGRYVTRKLRVDDGVVDQISPGFHGRFTAKAMLTAHFGTGFEEVDDRGMIDGTITDFKDKDGDTTDFEVFLDRISIGNGTITNGPARAMFGNTNDADGMGSWEAQTYGDAGDTDDVSSTLPSGVAGQFEVNSDYTRGCRRIRGKEEIIIN